MYSDAGRNAPAPFSVAFYGKGGIGKSTISSNVSYILSQKFRVLHIGCDPKHDSTRLLLPDRRQTTVLEKVVRGEKISSLEEIVVRGKGGVYCIESGGPEPGIGCAGRGIITAFNILSELGIEKIDPDFRVYDVLGDVVCGGFAVPMRTDYSDGIIIVTSGEYMSIFAANNILKGLTRFGGGRPRVLGIIQNSRAVRGEDGMVERFADAVGLPILAKIPRCPEFAQCEDANEPILALFPDSEPCRELEKAADAVTAAASGRGRMYTANPLDDDSMEDLYREKALRRGSRTVLRHPPCAGRGNITETCSAAGAADIAYFVRDMDIVLHGPDSCAYIFSSFHDRMNLGGPGNRAIRFRPSMDQMHCTGLSDADSIFGGADKLRRTLEECIGRGSENIMVITACMAGIIGDDVHSVIEKVQLAHPGVNIADVRCDGNMTGHMGEGLYMASKALLQFADRSVQPEADAVNLVGMTFTKLNERRRNSALERLLGLFGLRINCRFVGGCDFDSVKNLRKGRINILISDFPVARKLAEEIRDTVGIDYLDAPAPIGIRGTERWIEALGNMLGMEDESRAAVRSERERYAVITDSLRRSVSGLRVAIYSKNRQNLVWLTDLLSDSGAEVVYVGFGPSKYRRGDEFAAYAAGTEVREDYTPDGVIADFGRDRLDLLICRDELLERLPCRRTEPVNGLAGTDGLEYAAEQIARALKLPAAEGWRSAQ